MPKGVYKHCKYKRGPYSEEGCRNIREACNRLEVKEKIRKALLGKPKSEEHKQHLRKPKSEEGCRNIREAQNRLEVKEKIRKALLGKPKSPEHLKKIVTRNKKMKGKTYEEMYGEEKARELREILSKQGKKNWLDADYAERTRRNIFKAGQKGPNNKENVLSELLQRLFPSEYKYVGDGGFLLDGKCPDFVNVNGQKKIIELFGDYWHSERVQGVPKEQHMKERRDIFVRYGYKTLIIWEHELEDVVALEEKLIKYNRK